MQLIDLKPEFFTMQNGNRYDVQTVGEASGMVFTCPTCLNHPIVLTFAGPGKIYDHGWTATGNDSNDVTLTPSIWHHCQTDPHFFITNGAIVMA